MKIAECMTRNVEITSPDQPIREAARLMLRADAGSMPVGEDDRLVGMITDRDIAVRAVAQGRAADTPVRDVMTDELLYCFEDEDIEDVAEKMKDEQVRRFPVLNRQKRIVGIMSLGDIARTDEHAAEEALSGVVQPGGLHNQA